ncbi:MAG: hypothetical protein N3G21_07020 [Candidatus Hydrogenedentes bacterium]|nr:hypothetical protein [Candidatus Hydrogenedentota bacterium]
MRFTVLTLEVILISALSLTSCQTPEGGVVNKVLSDFGIREKPEGYLSETDKIFQRLSEIGNTELKRFNQESRKGEVKFEQKGPRGEYYKEVKVYEQFFPLDVNPVSHSGEAGQSYIATIQYSYRVFRSAPKPTRIEAQDAIADIPTGVEGKETYRYTLGPSGVWNGEKGQKVKSL